MARKAKKGFLPRIEIIIVLVFFLSFIAWAMSQCNAKKSSYEQQAMEEASDADGETETSPVSSIISELSGANKPERPTSEANKQGATNTTTNSQNTSTTRPRPSAPPKIKTVYATKLFVTIDGLKFRSGPSMDSIVLLTLPIDQELEFMNEVSDTTQAISMGNGVIANERWIKVRHWKGHEGWVYGAGVNYFKPTAPATDTE